MASMPSLAPQRSELAERDAKVLLAVIRELTAVMLEENEQLKRRVPAGLTAMIERKVYLSGEYERLWKRLLAAGPDALAGNTALIRGIVTSVTDLRKLTEENMTRLESAADASRRRIEAVMNAIRSEETANSTYGSDGATRLHDRPAIKVSATRA